jgi:valyl-tRNA synthetase
MEPDATMSAAAGEYAGLDRYEARRRVVAALEAAGALELVEDHVHAVGRCYRCDTVVEPYLSDQWFVKMAPLAEPALAAWGNGELRFTPERWGKVYTHWLENVRDWCISRQIWWGHRIPVWTCAAGHAFAAREDPATCPECGSAELAQDPDVLDTWFSAWLWPFSTLGWPDETEDLATFYPTNTLVTASEILFFWVARMVMAGYYCTGEAPFSDVVINGTVRDAVGRRMSKSLGNGIDPRVVIDEHGADALRYTLLATAPTGTDLNLAPDDFKLGRNFANKLWNAARFVLLNLPPGFEPAAIGGLAGELGDADRWILHRLDETTRRVTASLDAFRLDEAALAIQDFLWHDYCDWTIEWSKAHLETARGDAVRSVLVTALERSLRLLHPIMPFVTEELWREMPASLREGESIMIAPWPEPAGWDFPEAVEAMKRVRSVISAVRELRGEYGVAPGRRAPVTVAAPAGPAREALERHAADAARLAWATELLVVDDPPRGEGLASRVVEGGIEVAVRLADLMDVERERRRLSEEIERAGSLLAATRGRLANEAFVARAPEEVVRREREKAADLEGTVERLGGLLAALGADR